jgi:Major Facilitator Superfamily
MNVHTADTPVRARRKIARRILPFVSLLYIVAYLDRANVAFANVPLRADLGFNEAVFGFGAGIFFIGYFLLEIPGALIVERWSARRWLARIIVSWGICTILIGFVRTEQQFFLARFRLGAAEAGFFPVSWLPDTLVSRRGSGQGDRRLRHSRADIGADWRAVLRIDSADRCFRRAWVAVAVRSPRHPCSDPRHCYALLSHRFPAAGKVAWPSRARVDFGCAGARAQSQARGRFAPLVACSSEQECSVPHRCAFLREHGWLRIHPLAAPHAPDRRRLGPGRIKLTCRLPFAAAIAGMVLNGL